MGHAVMPGWIRAYEATGGRTPLRLAAAGLLLALLGCGGSVPAWNAGPPNPDRCRLDVVEAFDADLDLAFPRGSDVLLAVDVSQSTRLPMPVHGGGKSVLDGYRVAPDQTRLAAQVGLACGLLRQAAAAEARAGLVVFSGMPPPEGPADDARLLVAPTSDLLHVVFALDALFERGPNGGTNYAAALNRSLAGFSASGRPRRVVLITDGIPTLPEVPATESGSGDWDAAFSAADRLAGAGVRLDIVAVGEVAASPSFGLIRSIALATGGKTLGFFEF